MPSEDWMGQSSQPLYTSSNVGDNNAVAMMPMMPGAELYDQASSVPLQNYPRDMMGLVQAPPPMQYGSYSPAWGMGGLVGTGTGTGSGIQAPPQQMNYASAATSDASNPYFWNSNPGQWAASSHQRPPQPMPPMMGQEQQGVGPQPNVAAARPNTNATTGRPPLAMYVLRDDHRLSAYQILVRKQIQVFEAQQEDVDTTAQGRVRRITLGQVGIRCRHCIGILPRDRKRGAFYYPTKLEGVYQAAQNMAKVHLAQRCLHVVPDIRAELIKGMDRKSLTGGGKQYWGQSIGTLGVYEAADCLRFNVDMPVEPVVQEERN
jgi:hypothetical protein